MIKIKPCPFCGGEAKLKKYCGGYWFVECQNCYVTKNGSANDEETIKKWNNRIGDNVNDKSK